jgi:hypothetical protein
MHIYHGVLGFPEIAWRYDLTNAPDDYRDPNAIEKRRSMSAGYGKRWVELVGNESDPSVSYTQCQSLSFPQSGAMCFPNIWVGGTLLDERRITAVDPKTKDEMTPNMGNAVWAQGAYRPGDTVINTCSPNTEFDIAKLAGKLWPWAWRPRNIGGQTRDTWKANYPYRVGDVVIPTTMKQNGFAYRAETAGTSVTEPDEWPKGVNDTVPDPGGSILWRNIGVAPDKMEWVPLIPQASLQIEIDLSGGSIDYTDNPDACAYERIKFKGDLTHDVSVVIPKGASDGWMKVLWNATTGADTEPEPDVPYKLTVKGSSSDTGINIPQGQAWLVISDGTNVVHVT